MAQPKYYNDDDNEGYYEGDYNGKFAADNDDFAYIAELTPPPLSAPPFKINKIPLEFCKDVNIGPLWNNDHAQNVIKQFNKKFPKFSPKNDNKYGFRGANGQWQTYPENWGKTSHIQVEFYEERRLSLYLYIYIYIHIYSNIFIRIRLSCM